MEDISKKWLDLGLNKEQDIIDAINIAYEKKEKLDSNIYVGETTYGNICMCLDSENKIEKAFPVVINANDYLNIKKQVQNNDLGNPDELHLQVVSLFFAIDLTNHKKELLEIINKLPQDLDLSLFNCTITEDLTIINIELGQIVINTEYVKKFLIEGAL